MTVYLIAAIAKNNAIGKDNKLLWHLPADMEFFKKTTLNHVVIMGRKNYESIPDKFRPLPNRINIIVTRKKEYIAPDCLLANSIEEALKLAEKQNGKKIFIIGGGEIYNYCLEKKYIDTMYISKVDANLDADAFFPSINECEWNKTSLFHHAKDEKNNYDFTVYCYEKRS